jgi:hypothetical protein
LSASTTRRGGGRGDLPTVWVKSQHFQTRAGVAPPRRRLSVRASECLSMMTVTTSVRVTPVYVLWGTTSPNETRSRSRLCVEHNIHALWTPSTAIYSLYMALLYIYTVLYKCIYTNIQLCICVLYMCIRQYWDAQRETAGTHAASRMSSHTSFVCCGE